MSETSMRTLYAAVIKVRPNMTTGVGMASAGLAAEYDFHNVEVRIEMSVIPRLKTIMIIRGDGWRLYTIMAHETKINYRFDYHLDGDVATFEKWFVLARISGWIDD